MCGKLYVQIHLVAHYGVGRYLHEGEQTMPPIPLHGISDFVSWDRNLLSNLQSRDTGEHVVLISLDTRHAHASENKLTWCSGIGYVGVNYLVLCHYGHAACKQSEGCSQQLFYLVHCLC